MKQRRRQELKTNELSIYLGQMYDFLVRNSTYVVGGVVVVALVIIVATMNARSQHRAKVDAMNRIRAIQSGEAVQDLKLLDEIKDLIAEYGDDPWLGPSLLDLQASLAHHLALGRTSEADKAEHDRLLDEARSACERAIQRFRSQPLVMARAKLALAAVEETLFVEGKGDQERIRKLYQEVIDGPVSPYQRLASEQLSSLDARLAKLEIVATRPAAGAPTSASAITLPPIALPTAPATATIAPATEPAAAPVGKPTE
ncbi:MAG TPA: hypothetical protein PLL20_11715 [Phycisphaerae bacterium]|nr:hypothetical protein [Phycisphaerae bacterium]HRR86379.1 hypothetical protein [Phycisphaerae bacterium]